MLHDLEGLKTYKNKGYIVVYYPEHPRAWKGCGLVFLHRLIMENHLNRILEPSEHVHHDDENILNNDLGNLMLKTPREHALAHRPPKYGMIPCKVCGVMFKEKKKRKYCCSIACNAIRVRRVSRPSKAELQRLVWETPTSTVAKRFDVSDVTVAKWCKSYGIDKPPRGYWQKQRY